MFEEEAEEYKDNTRIKDKNTYVGFPNERISELQDFEGNYIDISERIIKAFKDGAEYGFQKGLKAKINTTTISDCPIKDEWHYMKDGDYPEEYKDLWICFISEDDVKDYVRGWYEYDFDNDKHIFKYVDVIGTEYLEDVYAWQTLVPPKE